MALFKDIRQDDGVTTKYHRILFLQKTVNRQNSIAVLSYTDETARVDEKEAEDMLNRPYQKSVTYETDYDAEMTIDDAYKWLKTLPQFEGAEDI